MSVRLMSFQYIIFTPTEEQSWWCHGLRGAFKNEAGLYRFVLRLHLVYLHTSGQRTEAGL